MKDVFGQQKHFHVEMIKQEAHILHQPTYGDLSCLQFPARKSVPLKVINSTKQEHFFLIEAN